MLTWESTWQDVERSNTKTAVVPIGSTEQHGTNLPLACDSLLAQHIAEAVAKATHAYLLPVLPFGQSEEWLEYPGSISLSKDTMRTVVADIVRSLATTGFQKILFLSAHGGNDVLWSGYLDTLAAMYPGVAVLNVDLVPPFEEAAKVSGLPFPNHADETEASLIMALRPDLVGANPTDCPCPPGGYPKGKTVRQISPGGSLGSPSLGSAQKGRTAWEVFLRTTVESVLKQLR